MRNQTDGRRCETCKELNKQIEMVQTTWEGIEFEVSLYRHKLSQDCIDELVVVL